MEPLIRKERINMRCVPFDLLQWSGIMRPLVDGGVFLALVRMLDVGSQIRYRLSGEEP